MKKIVPPELCEACHRKEVKLTKHHLIPATLHSNKWFKKNFTREEMQAVIWVCRPCHNAIHRFISHKELAREFNTLEKIMSHPEVKKFAEWQSKR